jgi:CheY-like chemotaxis protein
MTGRPVILCVDDTPRVLDQKVLLEENGYQVLTVTNGKEAVQAFMSNSVDLVLLDDQTPDLNSAVVAARMKDSKPDVPVALLSGNECLPPPAFQAVDCLITRSEPTSDFLEKVDYLLSLRFLFQPLGALMTEHARKQRGHK